MKCKNKRLSETLLVFLAMFNIYGMASARESLITDSWQLSANQMSAEEGNSLANLIDGVPSTGYHSQQGELADDCYILVELKAPLNLAQDEDLVFFTQRCGSHTGDKLEGHPTTFRVEGSFDGNNWEPFCHVYFLYRGNGTREYSSRVRTTQGYKYLRLTVTANNARHYDSNGHRYMGMAEFQIYKLGRTEPYEEASNGFIDRLHLKTDYNFSYRDYGFVNTMGILDPKNHCLDSKQIDTQLRRSWDIEQWLDWGNWVDGKWTKDQDFLKKNKISIPSFTMLTSNDDKNIGPNQKRQPTHVTEHVLYAIPGDAIALYPYYAMAYTSAYLENFSHWYDYNSGGRLSHQLDWSDGNNYGKVDLLDFLTNPYSISYSDNYGFFGGSHITPFEKGAYMTEIRTVQEYLEFEKRVNDGDQYANARLVADLDFSGVTVSMIGVESKPYAGVFDGGGHTISNLVIDRADQDAVGMFRYVTVGAKIMNFHLDETCVFRGDSYAAPVAVASGGSGDRTDLYLSGIWMSGESYVNYCNAAGILGSNWSPGTLRAVITDCLADGKVIGYTESAAISGWLGDGGGKITNTYSCLKELTGVNERNTQTVYSGNSFYRGSNCRIINSYDSNRGNGLEAPPIDMNSAAFISKLGDKWKAGESYAVPMAHNHVAVPGERSYGTVATFFYPRDPYVKEGELQGLPQEYVIAADFSQSFSLDNIDRNTKTITEPVIHFRHIFKIRDGKSFAEEFSGSLEKNREYIRKNMRHVSARAGKAFQIRFDSPIPASGTTRSKYYYKISETDYRRVCTMRIRVLDADTRTEIDNDVIGFYAGEEFDGQGSREIDGVNYYMCGGGGKYYRMLKCDNPREGRYLVQILGNDINGKPIKIIGSNEDLIVMEMQITFLPESKASMITEDELYSEDDRFKHARESELEANYGAPKDKVDFDEYALLESKDNVENPSDYIKEDGGHKLYRLPVPWDRSTYTFGYDTRFDYGMYMLGSHSSVTPYKEAAQEYDKNYDEGKGLYDRLFYKTRREGETPRRGYFYYVNAAQDPGVMARLNVDKLCLGSTIHVSAWVAEFSSAAETANLAFNFVAVMKETGDRVPLHSYVTGYVDRPRTAQDDEWGSYWPPEGTPERRGQWMNVYYSFVPNYSETGITTDQVDHYELELDNNCKNSGGADYAIDNIRVYITQPVIYGSQLSPVCDKETTTTKVKIETPFSVLLQTIGADEVHDGDNSEIKSLYYTFIDKRKFDLRFEELMAAGDLEPGRKAYEEAVLRYQYRGQGDADQTFGKLSFNTNFKLNPDYDEELVRDVASKETTEGERMIVFNTMPTDENLSSGKEYYVSLYSPLSDVDENLNPGWTEFDIKSDCARMCVFRVRPSSVIKIDGELRSDIDDITCCENQSPVVQVNLYGIKDGEMTELDKNAYLDWFDGTNAEYLELKKGDISLSDAMVMFRNAYPYSESADVEPVPDLGFTEEVRDYVLEMTTVIPEGKNAPLITLYKSSYVFAPVKLNPGEEYRNCYVLALPITAIEGNTLVCAQPTEVKMKVRNQAPELNHGLRGGIVYPERMIDVPLRIGLKQLHKVSAPENTAESHADKLNIPLWKVDATSEDVQSLRMMEENTGRLIYLVETNDPAYKDLGTLEESGVESGALMPVGELVGLTANIVGDNSQNAFNAVFYDNFHFREGYYYRMRFMFEENVDASEINPDNSDEEKPVICSGQDVFTIKVVPAYQKWTGRASDENKNWNNDLNWSRVNYDDLFVESESRKEEMKEYVADGIGDMGNDRVFSYAPLDFTKVIIPEGEKFPHLLSYNMTDMTSGYSGIKNPDGTTSALWPENPSEDTDGSSPAGEATPDIQYDMAAYSSGNAGIDCRPWYANTCAEIHFRPCSEIEGQRHLVYEKAWVDVENKPGRWYTLGMPLKSVYAGDMYLPSDDGCQETELFRDIVFSTDRYNRFSPAVFQRSWNKSRAMVYEIKDGPSVNVAIKADWSHVYNDVTENYGLGTGFSIKTDAMNVAGNDGDKVLFRLPKSDTSFDYYSHDGTVSGNHTEIQRDEAAHFRLNDVEGAISAVSRGDNRYFLVGNPFMSHLDMEKFLTKNAGKVNPKYWILTEGSQKMAVFDESAGGFVGSASGLVAPLQGFFVEAKEGASVESGDGNVRLTLDYDETMSCVAPFAESPLRKATRSGSLKSECFSVAAIRDGEEVSRAYVNVSSVADNGYSEKEDVMMFDNSELDIPVSVYTVADNRALSVNTTGAVRDTEIGLEAADREETTLLFEGVDHIKGLALYDSQTGESTEIYEGMDYQVSGSVSGRLFLIDKTALTEDIDNIRVSVKGNEVKVTAGNDAGLEVTVYDMPGAMVHSVSEPGNEVSFTLERGVYVLVATDGMNRISKKIMIKK